MEIVKRKVINIILFSKSSKATLALGIEILLGIATIIVSLSILFRLAHNVLNKEVISFDTSVTDFVYSFRSPFMTDIMSTITFLGGDIFLAIAIIITILLLLRKHKKDALIFSFILFFGTALNLLLKSLFARPRPELMPLVRETSYSFPSGHAMNSFVFYMALSYFIFRNTGNRKLGVLLTVLSCLLVFLIGISRIYLGVHYPSDVVAGYFAGLFWFAIVLLFEKTLIFLRLFKNYEVNKKY